MKARISMSVLLVLIVAASACVYKGGDKEYVQPPALGAELTDLKKAYDRGAINEQEYRSKREKLLIHWERRARTDEKITTNQYKADSQGREFP